MPTTHVRLEASKQDAIPEQAPACPDTSQRTNFPIALKRGMRRVEDQRIADPADGWRRILRQDESPLVALQNDC
jgi:hypothetical protein